MSYKKKRNFSYEFFAVHIEIDLVTMLPRFEYPIFSEQMDFSDIMSRLRV